MNNNSIQIELNNHPYQKDVYYVSIGLRGGYVVSDYILNEKEHFASNRAFSMFYLITMGSQIPHLD